MFCHFTTLCMKGLILQWSRNCKNLVNFLVIAQCKSKSGKYTRQLVYDVMYDIDPKGLGNRAPCLKKTKRKFSSPRPDMVYFLDGHDKLMGYRNSTYHVAIYVPINTASRKLLWVKVWVSVIQNFLLDGTYSISN